MSEEQIKKLQRTLLNKTLKRLEKENFYCAAANGKLSQIATAIAVDKGIFKIIKSVYEKIDKKELERLLHFNEAPSSMNCIIEIWFWRLKEREPFKREKFIFNQPDQEIEKILNLVKD